MTTFVLVVLCALASASVALAGGPSEAYCVDLTTGKTSILPGDTADVEWTTKPTSNGGRCNLQGVLKISPPSWAKSVSFLMAFENSTKWSFNIGDSPTNDGWGGDSGLTTSDAEIHSSGSHLYVYRSDIGGAGPLPLPVNNAVKTSMLIRLSRMQMYATNYEGFNYYKHDEGLFAFDTMYMGLNRVVSGGRHGTGLCSVCVYFLKEAIKDLYTPYVISHSVDIDIRQP